MTIPNPYEWQEGFQESCINKFLRGQRDYICVVTPGGGKTIGALKVAVKLRDAHIISHIVIVAPQCSVVSQWSAEAHKLGLNIERFGSPERRRKYDGIAVTYGSIASGAQNYRSYCNEPTLVILDEVHHADEKQAWGEALRAAFEAPTTYRLMLSGTPFRTKGIIPFVPYDLEELREGRYQAVADFTYSHGEAVNDGACRRVVFPSIDVPMVEWTKGDGHFAFSLSDTTLRDELESERNSVVLDASSEAVRLVLEQAHRKLTELRRAQPNTGGLVLAKRQEHALQLAEVLESIAGVKPVVAISEDPESDANIERFRNSSDPWIVSVRMVSEGVDIKRLQVLAYLTKTDTPMFFRQAVGRVVRTIKGARHRDAYVFILNREPLITLAAQLEAEQTIEIPKEKKPREGSEKEWEEGDPLVYVSCEAGVGSTILTGGADPLPADLIDKGGRLKDLLNLDLTAEEMAEALRDCETDDPELLKRPAEPKDRRMERKTRRSNSLAHSVGMTRGYAKEEAAKLMHKEWARMPGNHWQANMDEPELDRKIQWLIQERARAQVA